MTCLVCLHYLINLMVFATFWGGGLYSHPFNFSTNLTSVLPHFPPILTPVCLYFLCYFHTSPFSSPSSPISFIKLMPLPHRFLCYFHSTTPLFSHLFSLYSPYPSILKVRHFYFRLVSSLEGVCWS